jgi:hypothetical protein
LRVVEVGRDAILPDNLEVVKEWGEKKNNTRDNSLFDGLAKFGLRNFLHFGEDHGGNFLGAESLIFAKVLDLDERGSLFIDDCKWPVLHVLLNRELFIQNTNRMCLGN